MKTRVKICGITNAEDALAAWELGADVLGFVFAESPRRIRLEEAERIASRLSGKIELAGVFAGPDDPAICRVCRNVDLDWLQVYFPWGTRSFPRFPRPLVPAYWMEEEALGRGIAPSRALFDFKKAPRLFLRATEVFGPDGLKETWIAGGLDSENVCAALEACTPYGVDAARGVERSFGKKDRAKLERFIGRVKSCS